MRAHLTGEKPVRPTLPAMSAQLLSAARQGPRPPAASQAHPAFPAAARAPHAPPLVDRVLRAGGEPLPRETRALLGPRLGHDFGAVRVHADAQAGESARAVNALAYTVGRHVVFAPGQYAPGTHAGRRLLAHELAHVVQQGGREPSPGTRVPMAPAGTPQERAAERAAGRVDAGGGAAAEPGMETPAHPLLQRQPAKVGPVNPHSGLAYDDDFKRLTVILGPDDTLRSIAKKVLPIFNQATPATPEGGGTPLPVTQLTVDELAKGLLVFNSQFLGVPNMTDWKVGLRLPLAVEVNKVTGERTLHTGTVATWAASFDPTLAPLLDQKPAAAATPTADELRRSVEAFLASTTTPLARGLALSTRALLNALEAQPFIDEAFRQLGPDGFEVALEFMTHIVIHQVEAIGAQVPGQQILQALRNALATPPAGLSEEKQKRLAQAHKALDMKGRFTLEQGEAFKQMYIREIAGCNCMTAVYKGLKSLYGEEAQESIFDQVVADAKKVMKATKVDTNHMDRIMETVRSRGKAGPMHTFTFGHASQSWTPDPEATLLGMTHPTIPGFYFFGFSVHGAYHSVILAVDKSDPNAPKIYWMDQFTKGFTKDVTGKLQAEMKNWKPSYGFAVSKVWQMLPASDTIIDLK